MTKQKPILNKADVSFLRKTFLTKDDAGNLATRKDLKNLVIKKDTKSFATKNDLNGFATKDDLNGTVTETSKAILSGVQKMFDDQNGKNDKRFQSLESKIENVKNHLRDEINGLKSDFSTSVSRKEFSQLKTKVDRHHPAN
jgi:hypothetical protein